MSKTSYPISIKLPILTTGVALLIFAELFLITVDRLFNIRRELLMVATDVTFIACSIQQWVKYFRGYVDEQIEKRLQDYRAEVRENLD
jgi:hypothetical protein